MKNLINKVKEVDNGTIARTVAVIAVLINQFLVIFGKEKLPFTEEEIYQGFSMFLSVGATLWAWWKNNSFTTAAIEGDNLKNALKNKDITIEDLKAVEEEEEVDIDDFLSEEEIEEMDME